jgi:hypothetical protein
MMSLVAPAILALSLSALFIQPIFAQFSQDRVPFPVYRIVPGKVDPESFRGFNAQLCVGAGAQQNCFPTDSKRREIEMPYAINPKATEVDLKGGASLMLFSADFPDAGSGGAVTSIALLEFRGDRHLRNLLPAIEVSNQSEFLVWNLPGVFDMPLLVTADFDWDFDPGETHYGRHRYWIEGYAFDRKTGTYKKAIKYLTKQAYPGLDDTDRIVVLEPEKLTILAKLSTGSRLKP